jgi:hypothetical protein
MKRVKNGGDELSHGSLYKYVESHNKTTVQILHTNKYARN